MSARTTLRRQLAKLIVAATLTSLVVFSAVAYVVILFEEMAEVEAGLPPEHVETATGLVLTAFAVAAPLCLALTLGGALWLSRRALSPLDRVIGAATEMSVKQLDRRLPLPGREDELYELTAALNGLFERIQVGFADLDRFAADASHELRTPLAILTSELEVALRRPRSTDEWSGIAQRSLLALRRLNRLVDALLELARGHGGEREPVDLMAVADEVLESLRARAEAAGITLALDAAPHGPVLGQPAALATAISALVANAIRYTPRGGSVRVQVTTDGGTAVHVDDSGPGIGAAERDIIFDPFTRGAAGRSADSHDTEASQGLGLGLTIVRRVVEHHGAQVGVTGSPLGGARFTVQWAPD